MVKYNESTIYKICCKDTNVTDEYVGSTTNFGRRKNKHKSTCNCKFNKDYNSPLYQCIRNNGGFENWDMVEVEKYEASDKQDLHKRERYWIETLKSSLNRVVPTQTRKEYYETNREILIIDSLKRYEANKETINANRKVAITCECGTIINKISLSRHRRTKKHLRLME